MPPFETASAQLQQQGWVRLAGTETGYSRGVRTLLKVVLWFGYSVLVAAVLTVLVLWLVGVHIHSQIIVGGSGNYNSRAVMPLTDAGLATVNGPLHPDLRHRLFYATGPVWNYLYRYIAVPALQGMSTKESMALVNMAQRMYLDLNRPGFD